MCDCASEEDDIIKTKIRYNSSANLPSKRMPSCDCTSEDDSEAKIKNDNLRSEKTESCDCTSEDDDEPKIKKDHLKSNRIESCDCTSEDDSESKRKRDNLKSNKNESCDCTSEDDSEAKIRRDNSNKSCDCTSEDNSQSKIQIYNKVANQSCDCSSDSKSKVGTESSQTSSSCDCTSEDDGKPKIVVCKESATSEDNTKPPFAIVQVQLSKSMLNLLSSDESSTSCDCTSSTEDSQGKVKSCSDKDDSLPSCDCSSESDGSNGASCSSEAREKKLECTLAIIKPEAVKFREKIERTIQEEGFVVQQTRWLQLTPEQASEFYHDNYEQQDFARLVAYMSSKPIVVLLLSKLDAIREWRMLMGPTKVSDARVYAPDSIRGRFGVKGDDMQNAVHGSEDEREAEREIHFFFADYILEPILQDEAAEEYLWMEINDVLSEGLIKCCEAKPEDPLVWLGNYLLDNPRTKAKYLLRSTSNLYD